MFYLSLLFVINVCSANLEILENTESSETFRIHLGEPNIIYSMPEADDATLMTFQQNSFCQVKQQTVQTETQQFTIIQQDDFKDYDFEMDTPLNFREFIGMVHINDGMLAITSDAVAYLIKFNYDNVLSKQGFATYGNSVDFAGVIWKANLQPILPSIQSRDELPQLVYSKKNNWAFVLYSDSAQYFSVAEMEKNDKTMYIDQISNWIQREERGLTKEIDGYLFSAVGRAGMDIYEIRENDVIYKYTVTLQDFKLQKEQLELKDFAIVKVKDGQYQLYLLDVKQGLILAYMFINQQGFQFELVIDVQSQKGGIAVDTKNGKNVFAAFEQNGIYFYIEYLINFSQKSCSIITKQESNYRIVDVDATDEFAIISGVSHHQIVFNNGYDFLAPHKQKIMFTQIGMRDFQFFQYTYEEGLLKAAVKDEYQYDDFFFGVTANNAFLTKFKFVPARVVCFADHNEKGSLNQYYTLKFNQSHVENNIVSTNKVIRTTKSFTVQVVTTFLFAQQWRLIRILLIVLGAIIFTSCKYHIIYLRRSYHVLIQTIQNLRVKFG
ncbi:unnamed protein product (macronuclear) [Paramecium tetraurelia]|uniref:Chromosome undetermined scaffold_1, whole genome shotgun sequence n=1 Tax=Paramecium tetraurelia TaxID=5888 RepID=Q6BGI9_PARTE|nr:hypothetical protein [Paramecium tetraurelia strain d4-2]XP_001423487.1 uncharacterized protein GSPATT00000525001 [Paramecium tetraurelia]CAH03231.1 hypothetical protein PTMB.34c [Paramecium tetraurelia]CAK56089.1 unnamed protein product [Paramecium tetraurelia]|eukprot:XP_001423487.1 hypothetical protein (macronuclear) [Paramecium tetraurelia strain d4-2]